MSPRTPATTTASRQRRTRELAETRQKILDAAREMFVRLGYEATTMRAIADRIEYTPTAIYHHFRNKEALLAELCAADFRALAGAFQKIGRIEDPIERLRRSGQTCADAIAAGRIRPEYQDPEELALMAWSALHGFLSLRIVKQDDDWIRWGDPNTTSARICEALLEGVLRERLS